MKPAFTSKWSNMICSFKEPRANVAKMLRGGRRMGSKVERTTSGFKISRNDVCLIIDRT